MNKSTPLFESHANVTLERARATYAGRGTEYGDTWRDCQFIKMKAVARRLGLEIPDDCIRALATAAFCDMKYWRNAGGYKDDSIVDGINYDAFLAEEMRILTAYVCCVRTCEKHSLKGSPFCDNHQPQKSNG